VDSGQEEFLRQTLDAERQKLTPDQRQKLDQFCEGLHANDTYSHEYAIKGAQAIHALDGTYKLAPELRYLAARADSAALEQLRREQRLADQSKPLFEQKGEERSGSRSSESAGMEPQQRAALETIRAREAQIEKKANEEKERAAKEEAARREPIPGAIQRFDGKIIEAAKEREAKTHAQNIERAAGLAKTRPNHARFDELKKQQSLGPSTPEKDFQRDNSTAEKQSEKQATKTDRDAREERIQQAMKDYAAVLTQPRSQGRPR
jgi:hypothetical protein